jgi:hypothetical protein
LSFFHLIAGKNVGKPYSFEHLIYHLPYKHNYVLKVLICLSILYNCKNGKETTDEHCG